jgi:metallo-beta-lactamase family protein
MLKELAAIVNEEMQDGGRIIVPAFSVGRTQSIVMFLGQLIRDGSIQELPIHVDSPMSREATRIMAAHPGLFDADTQALLASGHDPFYFGGVHYVADVEESKSLNQMRTGVIVSASGMCESGRILHHLSHSLGKRQDCVLLVGYQAHGTLGRKLMDGMREVNILGESHSVHCKVRTILGTCRPC